MRLVIIFLAISFIGCSTNAKYRLIDLDGIITYSLSSEYSISTDYSFQWVKRVDYLSNDSTFNIRFKPNLNYIKSIGEICNDELVLKEFDSIESNDFRNENLFYSPHYREQSNRGDNPVHYGGDIYSLTDSSLVISFRIKGKAILFSDVCQDYQISHNIEKEAETTCDYTEDKIQSTFIVLTKYDTTFSLNQSDIDNLNYSAYQQESFNIMWCE